MCVYLLKETLFPSKHCVCFDCLDAVTTIVVINSNAVSLLWLFHPGEIYVTDDKLEEVLSAAQFLQIRGVKDWIITTKTITMKGGVAEECDDDPEVEADTDGVADKESKVTDNQIDDIDGSAQGRGAKAASVAKSCGGDKLASGGGPSQQDGHKYKSYKKLMARKHRAEGGNGMVVVDRESGGNVNGHEVAAPSVVSTAVVNLQDMNNNHEYLSTLRNNGEEGGGGLPSNVPLVSPESPPESLSSVTSSSSNSSLSNNSTTSLSSSSVSISFSKSSSKSNQVQNMHPPQQRKTVCKSMASEGGVSKSNAGGGGGGHQQSLPMNLKLKANKFNGNMDSASSNLGAPASIANFVTTMERQKTFSSLKRKILEKEYHSQMANSNGTGGGGSKIKQSRDSSPFYAKQNDGVALEIFGNPTSSSSLGGSGSIMSSLPQNPYDTLKHLMKSNHSDAMAAARSNLQNGLNLNTASASTIAEVAAQNFMSQMLNFKNSTAAGSGLSNLTGNDSLSYPVSLTNPGQSMFDHISASAIARAALSNFNSQFGDMDDNLSQLNSLAAAAAVASQQQQQRSSTPDSNLDNMDLNAEYNPFNSALFTTGASGSVGNSVDNSLNMNLMKQAAAAVAAMHNNSDNSNSGQDKRIRGRPTKEMKWNKMSATPPLSMFSTSSESPTPNMSMGKSISGGKCHVSQCKHTD